MTHYTYGKDTIDFLSITGDVLSPNNRQTLSISSSSRRVSSSTQIDTHFWIETDDGQELEVSLPGYDVQLREGHRITLIIAAITKGSKWGVPTANNIYVGLVNHATNRTLRLNDACALRYCFHLRNNNFFLVLLHIASIVGISFLLPALGAILGVIYALMSWPTFLTHEKFNFDFIDYYFSKKAELNAAIDKCIASA